MQKITYLLGAGASAEVLPVIKNFTKELLEVADEFQNNPDFGILDNEKHILCNDFRWLAENSAKFMTPDNFAKFLYLTNRNELKKLKKVLSFFFILKQFKENKYDKRALVFLTTILNSINQFPKDVKILNWNYDFQIQMAAEVFHKELSNINKNNSPLLNYWGMYFCPVKLLPLQPCSILTTR